MPFLERGGGIAPDLPGFGNSAKPADFDYSIEGYADFLEAFVDALGLERFSLVVHDWGVVGLALAQRRPERVERLVIVRRRAAPAGLPLAPRGARLADAARGRADDGLHHALGASGASCPPSLARPAPGSTSTTAPSGRS